MELVEWHIWWKQHGSRGLRRVLMEEWDPIGVRGVPEAADEYDSYLGPIAERLRSGQSAEEIAAYLNFVTEERMGWKDPAYLVRARQGNLAAAQKVVAWYARETADPGP
jgi:hypothetical protein